MSHFFALIESLSARSKRAGDKGFEPGKPFEYPCYWQKIHNPPDTFFEQDMDYS